MNADAMADRIKKADAVELDEIEADLKRTLAAHKVAADLVRALDQVAERRRELNVRQPGRLGVVS